MNEYIAYIFAAFILGALTPFAFHYMQHRISIATAKHNLTSQSLMNDQSTKAQVELGAQQLEAMKIKVAQDKIWAEREFVASSHEEKMEGLQ